MKKALSYTSTDNVLTALEELFPGDEAGAANGAAVAVKAHIPVGHKFACADIPKDSPVYKFGYVIGYANENIEKGDYVHVHNVRDSVKKWSAGNHTFRSEPVEELPDSLLIANPPKLYGYKRRNGLVGFRNHVLVVSTVVCANTPVEEIAREYRDVMTISNPTGCVILPNEVERLKKLLLGLARNPNVGAVIFCGLGCEAVEAEWYYNQVKDEKPAAYVRIHDEGSCDAAYEKLKQLVVSMKEQLAVQRREAVGIDAIRLGTKCGGSDWTTAAVANPEIGMVSDIIVRNGGISMQGETTGWFGGEDFLIGHARTREVAQGILDLMEQTYRKCESVGRHVEEGNPTPGNIAGGITTLAEKALGNVKKGGRAPIEKTIEIGEYPPQKAGLYIAENPGLDPISILCLTASGANVLIYSTGRGSPVGTPLAPSIKITASPVSKQFFSAHIDVDLTDVTMGEETMESGADRLFQTVVSICNGELCIAEKKGNREVAFPLVVSPL